MKLHITQLKCNVNDEFDGDEIYLKYDGKKIWPARLFKGIRTGEELSIDLFIEVPEDQKIIIELWEYDLLTMNDHLGSFEVILNEYGGPFQTSLKLKEKDYIASYLLTWEVNK